jgi:hypothetical protein
MPLTLLPVELLLMVIAFLNTRDVVFLSRTCKSLHGIAEDERARRQDISKLLKRYVDDSDGFRRLMRDTGGIIVGDFARAFFTGDVPRPKELKLLFNSHYDEALQRAVQSWTAFFGDVVNPRVAGLRKKVIINGIREVS